MDGKFDDVELLFIERTLELHGEHLCDLLREEIQKKTLIKESALFDSIDFSVRKYGINPVLLVSFFSYGRAIEIAWHKKKQNTKTWTRPNTNLLLWGIQQNKKFNKKKDSRWYAKTAYGTINTLIAKLSAGFSDLERIRLKQILEKRHESSN